MEGKEIQKVTNSHQTEHFFKLLHSKKLIFIHGLHFEIP